MKAPRKFGQNNKCRKLRKLRESAQSNQDEEEVDWFKRNLREHLESEANFNEAREKHFKDKDDSDDDLVWEDEYYKDFNKKKEMKITEDDKDEAMKTQFLMTLGQIRYYNAVNNRPKLKKQED